MKTRSRRIIPVMLFSMILCMILSIIPRLCMDDANMSLGDLDSETGLPYFGEMDCFYHERMTKDIAKNGHPGDTLKDGVPWDSLGYAPEGRDTSDYKPLMAYLAIAANRVISVFTPQSLEQTAYYLNGFLSALAVIPVFLLTFEMCGLAGAVVASLLAVLNLSYVYCSVPSYYDTESVIIWVSCFFFWFGVKLVKGWQKRNRKSLVLNGIGFAVSFFCLINCWYIYYFFPVLFAGTLILFSLLTWKKNRRKGLLSYVPLLLAAGIILLTLILEKDLLSRVISLFKRIFLKEERSGGLFGNVYASINELQSPAIWSGSLSDLFRLKVFLPDEDVSIICLAGGILPFLSAFAMCIILIWRIIRRDIRIEYVLLLLWYAVTLALSFRGQRFIILFAVPMAILTGNLAGTVYGLMDRRKLKCRTVYISLISILLLFSAFGGVYDLYAYIRSFDPADLEPLRPVEESLLKIRENTPEDTVLATWWDNGYFLEEKARRKTLFDGGTQNPQRTYFVARAFFTENEKLSANIFRMLAGGGDAGCNLMFSTFGETEETLLLLDELLTGSKAEAREKLLKMNISEDLANEITGLLFPENLPLTECIISADMPAKSPWFPILGRTAKEREQKTLKFILDVDSLPFELSESERNVIDSEEGYYVILEKGDSGWTASTSLTEEPSGEEPRGIYKLIFNDADGYREYVLNPELAEKSQDPDAEPEDLPWTLVVTGDGQEAKLSLMSPALEDSVLGKLAYFGGNGLTQYQAEPELSGGLLVYRIIE